MKNDDESVKGAAQNCSSFLRLFDNIDHQLTRAATMLGGWVSIAVVVIVAYSVFMRYLANIPQTWTDELVGYFLVAIVMFGVADTLRRNNHITVDLLTGRFGPKGRLIVDIWSMVAVIAVSSAMVFSSYQMVDFSLSVGLISDGYVEAPMWIPQSALLIGYGLLILSAVNRLLRLCYGLNVAEHEMATEGDLHGQSE
jgi:TRAP-type C4-dicarboxylate transport system permease small subunit